MTINMNPIMKALVIDGMTEYTLSIIKHNVESIDWLHADIGDTAELERLIDDIAILTSKILLSQLNEAD